MDEASDIWRVIVDVRLAHDLAQIPVRSTAGSAGYDIFSAETGIIRPKDHRSFSTGLAVAIPPGWELQVRPRSGLAKRNGIMAIFGTIDSDYRGIVEVNLFNFSDQTYHVYAGDRIAQFVLAPVVGVDWEKVDTLSETERGTNGFGSTGL